MADFLKCHEFVFRGVESYCRGNKTAGCCIAPTIRQKHSILNTTFNTVLYVHFLAVKYLIDDVIAVAAEAVSQKIPFLQPPSTLDPFCVSQPPQCIMNDMSVMCLTEHDLLFSPALLYIPPCSHYGKTFVSVPVEQDCAGLRCGGSRGRILGWKL